VARRDHLTSHRRNSCPAVSLAAPRRHIEPGGGYNHPGNSLLALPIGEGYPHEVARFRCYSGAIVVDIILSDYLTTGPMRTTDIDRRHPAGPTQKSEEATVSRGADGTFGSWIPGWVADGRPDDHRHCAVHP
jgi:hypothetical protein